MVARAPWHLSGHTATHRTIRPHGDKLHGEGPVGEAAPGHCGPGRGSHREAAGPAVAVGPGADPL